MRKLAVRLFLLATMTGAAWPAPAAATFPGRNGRVLFFTATGQRVWTMDPDGSGIRTLGGGDGNIGIWWSSDNRFSWSPDGRKILLMTGIRNSADIAVMDADGGGLRVILGGDTSDRSPAWSPDGAQIVFERAFGTTSDRHAVVYVAGADGSNPRPLLPSPPCTGTLSYCNPRPLWSAAGRIAYVSDSSGSRQIWSANADGSEPRQLTSGAAAYLDWDWSPDGRRLAFVREDPASGQVGLFAVDSDGGNLVQLADLGPRKSMPTPGVAWAPDGSGLVFGLLRLLPDLSGVTDLFWADPAGGNLRQLTTSGDSAQPSWQPLPKAAGPGAQPKPRVAISKRTATLSRRGDAPVRITCAVAGPGGVCTGTLRLASTRSVACGRRKLHARAKLGAQAFRIEPRRGALVKVRLSRSARRMVACRRRVVVRAAATVASSSGGARSYSATLTLRAPR